MSEDKRASFGGKLSVVLVAAGSAIGLGALWRFPYIAGKHGGAAFLLVFLLSVFVVGIPAMLAEFAVGRKSRKNAVGAFRQLSKKWSWLGYNGVLGALLITGFYYIVAGWSLEYLVNSVTGVLYRSSQSFTEQFAAFQGSWRPFFYAVVFIMLTHIIVARGVEKGIEKASRIMMPALFIILVIMAVRVAFMPNAIEGYRFFLSPNFKEAFTPETIMMAIGQAFFSLSVGMGCMVTYASYFKKDNNLIPTSLNVSLLTMLVSLLAGLVIFPAVFSAGLQPAEGPSLIFITLPEIFKGMPLAPMWSAVFFLLVMLASLTSTISFHEVLTAYFAEEFKLSRKWGARITSVISIALSALTVYCVFDVDFLGIKASGVSFMDIFDYLSANILMPLGAMFTCIFVSWVMKRNFMSDEISNYGTLKSYVMPVVVFMLRYVTPLLILYIFFKNLGIL
ncbi:MAG: sodium-dependent transporter [Bacteroidaceae bacterium]|nr:sodium-dependent transporter [Bacteroidaceae bacterium]